MNTYDELLNLFDNAVSGIQIIDLQCNIIKINNTLRDWLGLQEQEISCNKCYETCASELCHTTKCAIERIIKGEKLVDNIVNTKRADGNEYTWLVTSKPYINRNGELAGIIQDFRDISEIQKLHDFRQKDITEQLHNNLAYNTLILNGINEVVALYEVTKGHRFKILRANNNFLETLNLTEKEVIGKYIEDVVPAQTAKAWTKNNRKVVKTGKSAFFEEYYEGLGVFEVKLFPVLDAEGICTHLIAASNDITEQKKMEDHQLKIQKLESVGLLAGGIAHDFNNILTAVIGNTSLARMKVNNMSGNQDKEKLGNWLLEIERASHQAKDLIQQLLTFSKGGNPILKTFSIRSLLTDTTNFALRGSNVRCNYQIAENLWYVEIDEGQMSQVIHNLVVNANHAMLGGGIITIAAENIKLDKSDNLPLPDGDYVMITIQDQGEGIPPEHINKIFDPYFSTKQMGSGLGLTTTYSVIRKHKGYITVESELGSGTTFHIYLPATMKKVKHDLCWAQTALVGKGKILVMDDEKIVRHVLADMLGMLGYDAVCVKDGCEAIEVYQDAMETSPFDAVIMDLTIPGGMGGKETIARLLKIDPQVKAIVSSGYSSDPVMANHKHYGFVEVMTKPYNVEKLGEVLGSLDKSHRQKRKVKSIS